MALSKEDKQQIWDATPDYASELAYLIKLRNEGLSNLDIAKKNRIIRIFRVYYVWT